MLVEATLDHFESFYILKCERTNIEWTGFSQAPSQDYFYKWYIKQLCSTKRSIYFLLVDNNLAGYCYLDTIDEYTVEIAYGISELYSGKGKGTELIAAIIDVLGERGIRSVVAWVSEANIGSSKILLKNSFIKKSQSEYRQLPLKMNASLFYLWQRKI